MRQPARTRTDRQDAGRGQLGRDGSRVDIRAANPPACVPISEELGRCRRGHPGRVDEGVSEDRCVPRRRGAVFLDLSDHVQHGDVAAAERPLQPRRRSARHEMQRRRGRSRCRRSRPTGRRSPTITCCAREMREQLIGALTHLPEVYRVPVILRDIQGLSTEEASAHPARQAADAQVAPAPRPADSAPAPRRVRGRRGDAPRESSVNVDGHAFGRERVSSATSANAAALSSSVCSWRVSDGRSTRATPLRPISAGIASTATGISPSLTQTKQE